MDGTSGEGEEALDALRVLEGPLCADGRAAELVVRAGLVEFSADARQSAEVTCSTGWLQEHQRGRKRTREISCESQGMGSIEGDVMEHSRADCRQVCAETVCLSARDVESDSES